MATGPVLQLGTSLAFMIQTLVLPSGWLRQLQAHFTSYHENFFRYLTLLHTVWMRLCVPLISLQFLFLIFFLYKGTDSQRDVV